MLAMLKAAGILLLAIVLLILVFFVLMIVVGGYRAVKQELEGGRDNGNNNPEP